MEYQRRGWRAIFAELDRLDHESNSAQKASRGRRFERVLHTMMAEEGLHPRTSYRPRGEEIDGSFVLDGRVLLVEAKWVSGSIPASTLYQFRGKVDGKLIGTVGVFISMSDYSPDAVDALLAGKTLNLILVSGGEIRAVVDEVLTFADLLRIKLRAAAEEGTPFTPVVSSDGDLALAQRSTLATRRLIIVEGQNDTHLLSALLRYSREDFSDVYFLVAAGRINIGRVAMVYETSSLETTEVSDRVIVVDGDHAPDVVRDEVVEAAPDFPPDSIFVLDPSLQAVLGVEDGWLLREFMAQSTPAGTALNMPAIWERAEANGELRRLLERLGATRQ